MNLLEMAAPTTVIETISTLCDRYLKHREQHSLPSRGEFPGEIPGEEAFLEAGQNLYKEYRRTCGVDRPLA
jgi:hypothetical protein